MQTNNRQDTGKFGLNAILMLAFILMTAFLGVVWLNNLKASCAWHMLPQNEKPFVVEAPSAGQGQEPPLDEGGNPIVRKEIHGFFRWLDWTLVDYSTATTFILFYGFFLITAGLFRIASGQQDKIGPQFPFSEKSDQIIVNLGLIGTIWGLIMIGFYNPNTINMPQLIICLKTAMWSTLLALIWVYIVQLAVVCPLMRFWNEQVNGVVVLSVEEEADMEELLNRFTQCIRDAISATAAFRGDIGKLNSDYEAFLTTMNASKAALVNFIDQEVRPIYGQIMTGVNELKRAAESNANASSSLEMAGNKQAEVAAKQMEAIDVLNARLTEVYGKFTAAQNELALSRQKLAEAGSENAQLQQALEVIRAQTAAVTRKNR